LYHGNILPPPTAPPPPAKDAGVREFFQTLGYKVECDRRNWDFWYNLYDENGHCAAQVDQGVPLADIVEDMIAWAEEREPTSKSDWKCSGEMGPEMKLLFKRVHDFKLYGVMPNGQRTLAL
jgi:hypothetical protein